MPGVLDGQNLQLRSLNAQHLDVLRGWRYETGFSSPCVAWPPSDEVLDLFTHPTDSARVFLIESRSDEGLGGEKLGWCGLRGLDWKNRHANLIWGTRRSALNLEAQAINVMIGFAFLELGLERVECEIAAGDSDAVQLLERTGFQREATRREAMRRGGRYVNSSVHAVLREDWVSRVLP